MAAAVQDHPADLINVAIEEFVRQRYELPAFSALDRLVQRVRTLVLFRLACILAFDATTNDRVIPHGVGK